MRIQKFHLSGRVLRMLRCKSRRHLRTSRRFVRRFVETLPHDSFMRFFFFGKGVAGNIGFTGLKGRIGVESRILIHAKDPFGSFIFPCFHEPYAPYAPYGPFATSATSSQLPNTHHPTNSDPLLLKCLHQQHSYESKFNTRCMGNVSSNDADAQTKTHAAFFRHSQKTG